MEAASGATGVLCALPEELGGLGDRARARRAVAGLELLELELDGGPALACVGGVGKVMAARAATLLLAAGATRRLLVVGTCGGLRRHLGPGTLVHCRTSFQVDLAVRAGRQVEADPELLEAWRELVPGEAGWFLTADRPVLTPWRRLRLARAFAGSCVADMETAAAAAVARAAGVPWAALRAVTDGAGLGTGAAFRVHYPVQAGRAADTVPALLSRLA
jgi:adenosylhomocysteine nucleosidase